MQNRNEQPIESKADNVPVETGNASNPSPTEIDQSGSNQLLDKNAEKYLREVASIEDLPDAHDQKEMDEDLEEETGK